MSVTININNLTLCHKGSSGVSMATLPDVCKSPSVPVPYPNIAFSSDLTKGTTTIHADGGNMCAKYGSEFFKSTGDEAGVGGGVKSGTFIKEATWITYSFDVKLEGKGACRLTDKMFHNHQNTVNAAGEMQAFVVGNDLLNVLCNIYCETWKAGEEFKKNPANKGKKFNYSQHAEGLGKGKYADNLARHGLKSEVRLLTKISQGTKAGLKKVGDQFKRKLYTADAVAKRLRAEAQERIARMVGQKIAKKAAKSAVLKFIPGVNAISIAWDLYDAYELYNMASEMLESTVKDALGEFVEVKPDIAQIDADGAVKDIYDYKFPGDRYRDSQDKIFRDATGKVPNTVDHKSCNNCATK